MVSFQLTDEQKMMKDTISDFVKERLQPIARECDESGSLPDEIVKKFWEIGILQDIIPEEFGGMGGERSVLTSSIILEELGFGDLSIAIHLLSPALFAIPVLECGSYEQKKKYLPLFCGNELKFATSCVMEPKINFDLASLSTTAILDEDEYVINGVKCYVPCAERSDVMLVYAKTKEGLGYAGVDAFIVEKGTSGVEKGEREKNMGLKAVETYEVTFSDCRVPRKNKLGEGSGSNFLKLMDISRLALSSLAVGVARASYEYAKEYAKTRHAFGEPIASRQAIAFMIAENAIEIDAARLLLWYAAWKMDRGDDATKDAYLAKRYASDMVAKVTDRGVQILGGHGYIREHPVEMWLRNGRGFATFEGLAIM
jgi:alkylation response protein AidB-like acyl-CoA dehydrogenase